MCKRVNCCKIITDVPTVLKKLIVLGAYQAIINKYFDFI